jgi:hypothetical protein
MPNKNYNRASDGGLSEIEQRLRRIMMSLTGKIPQNSPAMAGAYDPVTPEIIKEGSYGTQNLGEKVPFTSGIDAPGGRTVEALRAWAKDVRLPHAASMIGMMSGDAGADIGEARRMAGPGPMDDYISPAYKAEHPEWGAKQEERMQEYNTRVGKELAGVTGLDLPYDPMSGGKEQKEIQGRGITDEQAGNRQQWLEAANKYWEWIKKMQAGRG